jgi:hypothetical protein
MPANDEQATPRPWLRDGRLIYALQSTGYRKGVEQFENRFSASFQAKNEAEAEANAALAHEAVNSLAAYRDLLEAAKAWRRVQPVPPLTEADRNLFAAVAKLLAAPPAPPAHTKADHAPEAE